MEALFFYLFATLAVLAALLTVTRRDAVTSAFWLISCFLCVAALFALLNAHFIAILQILLYAGAIMVLFLFVIMFLGKDKPKQGGGSRAMLAVGFLVILGLGATLARLLGKETAAFEAAPASFGAIERVSELLLSRYLFAFEMTGLLLTVAVIGAVHLARREAHGSRGAKARADAELTRLKARGGEGVDA
ncbi:MAG TPA: NADH-quinone oxidoreductase subunit J [Candidatus Krumholzibacteria bacterium]|jgi:NADH-quinone oxidoreductase subunit J